MAPLWAPWSDEIANAVWKKVEKSRGYAKAKLFLKRVTGKELWLRPEVSVALAEHGGWSLSPHYLRRGSIVYSLGVGDGISFDLALIKQFGVEVHAFDPTPASANWLEDQHAPPAFHFHPWAVTGRNGTLTLYPRTKRDGSKSDIMYTMVPEAAVLQNGVEVPAFSIPTLMKKLGHDRVDLLKMDIEGAEYEVLDTLIASAARPQQLLVEFHHRFPSLDKSMTADIIDRLRMVGYRIFSVSGTGREVSFIRLSATVRSDA